MKKLLLLFVGTLAITSCSLSSNDSYCYSSSGAAALAVSGPETGQVNQQLVYDVSFKISNSCGSFDSFVETTTGFPKSIVAKVNYEGCSCQAEETTVTEHYTFTASAAGTYVLNFVTADADTPITKTVTITQ